MNEQEAVNEDVRTRFVRSNFCRVIYATGAWGSLTPQLNVHMALYNENREIPNETTISIGADGVSEAVTDDPDHLKREIEVEVVMNEGTAIALRDWLNRKIEEIQTARQELRRGN